MREDVRERTEQVLSKGQDNNTKQGGLDRQHDGLMIMMMMTMTMTMMTTTMTTMVMMMMASQTLRAASLVLIYG